MKNQKRLSAIVALLALGNIFSAQAAPTANIEIKGIIEPSACDVEVNNVADFGTLKRSDLKATEKPGVLSAGNKEVTFTISCDGKTRTGVTFQSTGAQTTEGVLKHKDASIGGYNILMKEVKLDGAAGQILSSTGDAYTAKASNQPLNLAAAETLSWSTAQNTTTAAAKQVTGTLGINAFIHEDAISTLNDQLEFNGTTVMEIKYL